MAKTSAALLFVLLAIPTYARADAQIGDWIGEYAMNHDGFQGTLRIQDSKRDCATPAWCRLAASYVDSKGSSQSVTIRLIDQAWQHMVFYVGFPGNTQRFDGYLMSWDKNRMAGTTVWEGRTFGFFAVKSPAPTSLGPVRGPARGRAELPPSPIGGVRGVGIGPGTTSRKTVNATGEVVTVMPDGSHRLTKPGECGFTTISPDGNRSRVMCNQVPPATPPFPDGVTAKWLDAHSNSLITVIRTLLANDQGSIDNYLRVNEPSTMGIYERIRVRAAMISTLTSSM